MTTLKTICLSGLLAALSLGSAFGQTFTLTQTTLSAATTAGSSAIVVASATGMVAPSPSTVQSELYIIDPGNRKGEAVLVLSIVGTTITVQPTSGGQGQAHASGSLVLIGQPNYFYGYNPAGACVTASTYVSPWVNTATGEQWLCSTLTLAWVPGWQNTSAPAAPTTAVASVAGATLPSGPLFHVTGTNAITDWTIPIGFTGGTFCIIPDGAYTTTATNKIALASTGVVSKVQCWTYEAKLAKFFPSY
jgi:hypothetical protein